MGLVRIDWKPIVAKADMIVSSYDTPVTLRQLFYRLVADETLPNTVGAYKALSHHTAKARRAGEFPDLIDNVRDIHQHLTFVSPGQARAWLVDLYRRDRTEGQSVTLVLGVEKQGLSLS